LRLDVAFTPAEVRNVSAWHTVVVIDVLRATSSITHALGNGARSVVPVRSVEQAARTAERLGRDAVLLCGERDTQPISGFDLGNSPQEFTAERVGGKTLVMTTTNGTIALLAGAAAARCYAGSLLNVSAVAERIIAEAENTLILCAGREGGFALEDAFCAGRIVRLVRARTGRVAGNDAAQAAGRLARRAATSRVLGSTAAGRRLRELGRTDDLAFCALEDCSSAVPFLDEQRIRLDSTP
jgi:2-phosphosulfolactate phosphatase